ncbi:MAG: adenylosuccinate synthase [Deltaproteobacteria bacterium]|jgi:adenylosuccinate synthase|nr:adenylosuccinate synthase [Deltaproteobacteria bacterium]MBW2533883.1 adenylosuccinate synthase [Deltaproteobacteria bacterium]
MPALVIVGAQWGDEGKGKVVDLLTENADVVVRYAGGPNAGHTLVLGEERLVFRLVPSGVLHEHSHCVLAQGMVLDPTVLLEELDTLGQRGLTLGERLFISDRAHLILPYHIEVDSLREGSGDGTKIGTTKRGIGPCYEDKIGRRGVRVGDLRDGDVLTARVTEALGHWQHVMGPLGGQPPAADEIVVQLLQQAERLLPFVADTAQLVDAYLRAGRRVLLEGAQGTLLDVDHGTYPFVTSSSSTAGGASTGTGLGPTRLSRVLGITKAYTTRVGAGPFPTELRDEHGEHLRDVGGEYGSVTGRPRSTGWLDLAGLRHARLVNGLDGLALTKLDVLTGLKELSVCVGYDTPRGHSEVLPLDDLAHATPVYETLEGWSEDITTARTFEELPTPARSYLRFIEHQTGLPLFLLSVGPRREETIVLREAFG